MYVYIFEYYQCALHNRMINIYIYIQFISLLFYVILIFCVIVTKLPIYLFITSKINFDIRNVMIV